VRVAVLAKASSIVGAAVGGVAAGMLLFLLTRPVVPALESMGSVIGTVALAAALVGAAVLSVLVFPTLGSALLARPATAAGRPPPAPCQ
jgi:hypothetical protein